jgi:hypothetical protein
VTVVGLPELGQCHDRPVGGHALDGGVRTIGRLAAGQACPDASDVECGHPTPRGRQTADQLDAVALHQLDRAEVSVQATDSATHQPGPPGEVRRRREVLARLGQDPDRLPAITGQA